MNNKIKRFIIVFFVILFCIGLILAIIIRLNRKNQQTRNNQIMENVTNDKNKDNINAIKENEDNEMIIEVNNRKLIVKLEDNSSTKALLEKLKEGDIVIDAQDYSNFEKVGELGFELPTNDEQITTKAGDVILYLGTKFVLYYNINSWNFTKLGEVTNVDGDELKQILGAGDVTMKLSIMK